MLLRRKSIFLTLWLSYILILLIPVTGTFILYTNMEKNISPHIAQLAHLRSLSIPSHAFYDHVVILFLGIPEYQKNKQSKLAYSSDIRPLPTHFPPSFPLIN